MATTTNIKLITKSIGLEVIGYNPLDYNFTKLWRDKYKDILGDIISEDVFISLCKHPFKFLSEILNNNFMDGKRLKWVRLFGIGKIHITDRILFLRSTKISKDVDGCKQFKEYASDYLKDCTYLNEYGYRITKKRKKK